MNEKIEESKTTTNHSEVETKSIDDKFDLGDELHDFDYGDEELPKTKTKGENDKSHSVVVDKKEPSSATKHELKPCVKAFFGIFSFMLIAALIISWMY